MVYFTKTYVVKKYAEGQYVHGRWTKGTVENDTIDANIQPITGNELLSLSVGRKELGKIKIYTDAVLNIATETTGVTTDDGISGDIVTWDDGNDYEVVQLLDYNNNIISHKKYIAELRKNEC